MRLLAAAFMLLTPAMARAAEGGMPQLDIANPLTLSQVVWGAIIFVVLYLLVSRMALPKVGEVLAERASRIATDLETAQAAKARSDAAVHEMTEATTRARAEAQATINGELEKAKGRIAQQTATLNERLDRQLAEAEAQIAAARASAMGALRQVATDTASTIVNRLTGSSPDRAQVDTAVGDALSARGLA